jgi:SAM-dependent methyltransferase
MPPKAAATVDTLDAASVKFLLSALNSCSEFAPNWDQVAKGHGIRCSSDACFRFNAILAKFGFNLGDKKIVKLDPESTDEADAIVRTLKKAAKPDQTRTSASRKKRKFDGEDEGPTSELQTHTLYDITNLNMSSEQTTDSEREEVVPRQTPSYTTPDGAFLLDTALEAHPDSSDSAFGSDDSRVTCDTESVHSSNIDYPMEDGRRYHRYHRDVKPYPLPNDDEEQALLEMQHKLWSLVLDGNLYVAPLRNPQHALDVGTGTGRWAIDFGDLHPNASVLGIDLSPIQSNLIPPNVYFQMEDIEDNVTFGRKFDLVHIRGSDWWMRDQPKFLKDVFKWLKPGGFVEFQEHDMSWGSSENNADFQWRRASLVEGAKRLGIHSSENRKKLQHLSKAGFVNCQQKKLSHSLSPTQSPKCRDIASLALANFSSSLDALGIGYIVHGQVESLEQVQVMIAHIRNHVWSQRPHLTFHFDICYAQKPTSSVAYS